MTTVKTMFGLAAAAVVVGIYLAWTAPPDALQGDFSRIINLHVPSLWLAFLAFGITALGSIMFLIRKRMSWDRLAAASAEVGVLFTGLGLVTGMVWGQAVWGTAWDWSDPRLTSTAVMFFVYVGYLTLRKVIDDPVNRARRSAILGSIAVLQVPLVYFSVNLFRTLHQTQSIRPDGATMPTEMLMAMLANVGAFTLLYIALMYSRIKLTKAEENAERSDSPTQVVVKPNLERLRDV